MDDPEVIKREWMIKGQKTPEFNVYDTLIQLEAELNRATNTGRTVFAIASEKETSRSSMNTLHWGPISMFHKQLDGFD